MTSVRGGTIYADLVATERQSVQVLEAAQPGLGGRLEHARTPVDLGEVLRLLSAPSVLPRLLDHILAAGNLTPLAALSYRHPNHFEKLVLAQVPSGHKVVVHVWPGGGESPHRDGNLHNHRWHFATRVLIGSYSFTEFEVAEAANGTGPIHREHRYSVGPDGEHRLEDVGPCRMVVTQRRTLRSGDTYLLPNSVVHQIEMGDQAPTVTLFVQGPPVSSSTRVFADHLLSHAGQVNPPRMTMEHYRGHLLGLQRGVAEEALRLSD